MKRFIFSFILVLASLAMYAQSTNPTTNLFGVGRRLAIKHLHPKPAANEVIGKVGGAWGPTTFNSIGQILQGNVIDTCNATGLVVVDLDIATTDYQIFVTPITTLGLQANISSKTDSAFTVKFWLNDTAANLRPVVFDYFIKKN